MFLSASLLILSPQSVNQLLPRQKASIFFRFLPTLQYAATLYYNTIKVSKSVTKTAQAEMKVSQNAHFLLQYLRT